MNEEYWRSMEYPIYGEGSVDLQFIGKHSIEANNFHEHLEISAASFWQYSHALIQNISIIVNILLQKISRHQIILILAGIHVKPWFEMMFCMLKFVWESKINT